VHIREQHMDFFGTRFECFKSSICIRVQLQSYTRLL
jgi:hypothetical protein